MHKISRRQLIQGSSLLFGFTSTNSLPQSIEGASPERMADDDGDMIAPAVFGARLGSGISFRNGRAQTSNQRPDKNGFNIETSKGDGGFQYDASINFAFMREESISKNRFSAEFAIRSMFGRFSSSTVVDRSQRLSDDSFRLKILAEKIGPAEIVENIDIPDAALKLFEENPNEFKRMYGTHLLVGVQKAASLDCSLELGTRTSMESLNAATKIAASYGVANVKISLESALQSARTHGIGSFRLSAKGGENPPEEIQNLSPNDDVKTYSAKVLNWLNSQLKSMDAVSTRHILLRPWSAIINTSTDKWIDDFVGMSDYEALLDVFNSISARYDIANNLLVNGDFLTTSDRDNLSNAKMIMVDILEEIKNEVVKARQEKRAVDPALLKNVTKKQINIQMPKPAIEYTGSDGNTSGNPHMHLHLTGGNFAKLRMHHNGPVPPAIRSDVTSVPQDFVCDLKKGSGRYALGGNLIYVLHDDLNLGERTLQVPFWSNPNEGAGHEREWVVQLTNDDGDRVWAVWP